MAALAANVSNLDLGDPQNRLAIARHLQTAGPPEAPEGVVALIALVDEPTVGPEAIEDLSQIAVTQPVHAGWAGLYDLLLRRRSDLSEEEKRILALRAAQARTVERSTRSQAVRRLQALAQSHPGHPDIGLALGDALLASNAAEQARAVYAEAGAGVRANDGVVLCDLARSQLADASAFLDTHEVSPELREAVTDGTLPARVEALLGAGYADTAQAVLLAEDGRYADAEAWLPLVDTMLARGESRAVATLLWRLVRAHPREALLRRRFVSALLESGQVRSARRAARRDEDALQEVYGVELAMVAGSGRLDDEADDLEQAWRLAPNQPRVLRERAERLLSLGKAREALRVVQLGLGIRPRERSLRDLLDRAAFAAGDFEASLTAHRAAIAASGPSEFWPEVHALADAHTQMAEQSKRGNQFESAVAHYRLALALRPNEPTYYKGFGGVLWSARRLEDARWAYQEAYRRVPHDMDALTAVVRLSIALNDLDVADTALSTVRWSRRVRELREDVSNARSLQAINAALENQGEAHVRAAFEELLVRYPHNARVLRALGDVLMKYGRAEEAANAYARARSLRPDDVALSLAEATANIDAGRPDNAHAILDGLENVEDPETEVAVRQVRARAFRAEGDRLWHEEDLDQEAFEAYRKSLDQDIDPWTLTSLAGLYLDHRQPSVAMAFYGAAVDMDGGNQVARVGQILALQQLGEVDAAAQALEEVEGLEADAAVRLTQQELEIQQAIAGVQASIVDGDLGRAARELEALSGRYPESPDVLAAKGVLVMRQGKPRVALQHATRALRVDPSHWPALAVAMEAGLALGRMAEVVDLLDHALVSGGGEHARAALGTARFAARVEHAIESARMGLRREALSEMSDLGASVWGEPDQWALLGGGYLTLQQPQRALEIYERSLEADSGHVPSLIGKASALESLGNPTEAHRFLGRTYDRNPDPRVGLALARLQGRMGRPHDALRTLERIRAAGPPQADPATGRWGSVEPLPVLALPNGEVPEDRGAHTPKRLSEALTANEIGRLEREMSASRHPYADLGGAVLSRAGTDGANRLNAVLTGAAVSEVTAGQLRFHADAMTILAQDGKARRAGVSASVGASSAAGRAVWYDARVGLGPLGFGVPPYVTWLGSVTVRIRPTMTMGLDTGRAPITDSLLSWTGSVDPATGRAFGQASNTWGGGWVTFSNLSLTDAGVRLRLGSVGARRMDPIGRREINGWVGQTLGRKALRFRIGANVTWLSHARASFRFEPGETGIFSPDTYTSGVARLGLDVRSPTDFRLCTTAASGPQYTTGDPVPGYFVAGFDWALELGAGLRVPLSHGWEVGLDGRWQSSGRFYEQTTAVLRLAHVPKRPGPPGIRAVSPIHGSGVANMMVCHD